MAGWRAHDARTWLKGIGISARKYNVKMIKLGTVIVLSPRVSRRHKGFWELRHTVLLQRAIDALSKVNVRVTPGNSQLYIGVPNEAAQGDTAV